jgi:hypothetical protein
MAGTSIGRLQIFFTDTCIDLPGTHIGTTGALIWYSQSTQNKFVQYVYSRDEM